MINSSNKMGRGKVTEACMDLPDFLYAPEAKNIQNERNVKALRTLLGSE